MSYMFYDRRYDRKIRHDQNTQVHLQNYNKKYTQNTWSDLSWRKKVNISKDEEKLDKKEKEIILTEVIWWWQLNITRLHAAS